MTYSDNKNWRLTHPDRRNKQRRKYYRQFQNAKNSRKRWTEEDMNEIMFHHFDRGLSRKIGRSVAAIQHMRCKLWKECL